MISLKIGKIKIPLTQNAAAYSVFDYSGIGAFHKTPKKNVNSKSDAVAKEAAGKLSATDK